MHQIKGAAAGMHAPAVCPFDAEVSTLWPASTRRFARNCPKVPKPMMPHAGRASYAVRSAPWPQSHVAAWRPEPLLADLRKPLRYRLPAPWLLSTACGAHLLCAVFCGQSSAAVSVPVQDYLLCTAVSGMPSGAVSHRQTQHTCTAYIACGGLVADTAPLAMCLGWQALDHTQ